MGDTSGLKRWVLEVVRDRYDNVIGRLSAKIGMSQGAFGRGLDRGTLKIENLLRLAIETGESPSSVLRMANKSEEADLIEQCYGTPRVESPPLRDLRRLLDLLPDDVARREFVAHLSGLTVGWRFQLAHDSEWSAAEGKATRTRPRRAVQRK